MAKRIAIIINGSRKLSDIAERTIELLKQEFGDTCHLFITNAPKHAIDLANAAANGDFTHIIAVGGDGTSNEVINGIKLSQRSLEVIFGIIPNGTGNDFLKSLGPFLVNDFVNALKADSTRLIDLIQIKSKNNTSYGLNIAGSGFDGHVVQTLYNMRKSIFKGKLAYVLAILRSFISFKKPAVQITSKDFEYSGKMLLSTACNGTTFGYGLTVNPDAKIDDGFISVALFGNVSLIDYLKKLGKLKRGELIKHPEVFYYKTKEFTLSTLDKIFTEIDGEAFDDGDITFSIQGSALKILAI